MGVEMCGAMQRDEHRNNVVRKPNGDTRTRMLMTVGSSTSTHVDHGIAVRIYYKARGQIIQQNIDTFKVNIYMRTRNYATNFIPENSHTPPQKPVTQPYTPSLRPYYPHSYSLSSHTLPVHQHPST